MCSIALIAAAAAGTAEFPHIDYCTNSSSQLKSVAANMPEESSQKSRLITRKNLAIIGQAERHKTTRSKPG